MQQKCLEDAPFFIVEHPVDGLRAHIGRQGIVPALDFLHLHGIIRHQLRRGVDGRQAAADHDRGKLHLQVRHRSSAFPAPVSCSAMRKSLAILTPRIRLFFMDTSVGLPAPAAMHTWSNPYAQASSTRHRPAEADAVIQAEMLAGASDSA